MQHNPINGVIAYPTTKVVTKDTRWDPLSGASFNDPATAYIAQDGAYVVRNDRTGLIVEISDRNSINGVAFWRNSKDGIATWETAGTKTGVKVEEKFAGKAAKVEGAGKEGVKAVGGAITSTTVILPGKVLGQFDMVTNPGPLASMPGAPAANFAGGKYTVVTLTEDVTLYRAGSSTESLLGQWFTADPPVSAAKVRIDTAVKPQRVSPITGGGLKDQVQRLANLVFSSSLSMASSGVFQPKGLARARIKQFGNIV